MSTNHVIKATVVAAALTLLPFHAAVAQGDHGQPTPRLVGRAVLPVETYAPGPPSGAGLVPAGQIETVINGIHFPTASQPVEGFSAVVDGRRKDEFLAMSDNGFGGKANSQDFLIRAYYVRADFKTEKGGSGAIEVRDFVQFSDPDGLIGFPIVREDTPERWLTGGDIDPESLQRGRHGDLWVGDEFGPWILHFDRTGRLLEPPISLPDGLISPNNPGLVGAPTVPNSRGIEAMAMTTNGRALIVVMEGAVTGDDPSVRRVYRYDLRLEEFSRLADYVVDHPTRMIADAQIVGQNRLLVIERDGGRGVTAVARPVYSVDLSPFGSAMPKSLVVELAAIPDPDLVSLPEIHPGDVGLGDPFKVTCESIESLLVTRHDQLVLTCDNNFPNTGRNPALADDTEMIVVKAPGL
jgi:glycerophosphoryl diester phosphodiesterase